MSHQSNIDHDEMAFEAGQEQGYHECKQELLGKLRLDHAEKLANFRAVEEYRKSFYAKQLAYIEDLVMELFGEEEMKRVKYGE